MQVRRLQANTARGVPPLGRRAPHPPGQTGSALTGSGVRCIVHRTMKSPAPMREPTYYILAALLDEPKHGWAIIKHAAAASNGRVTLAVGTLYGALDRLTDEGRVSVDREETVQGRTRRYYRLTDPGRQALLAEAARLHHAARVVTGRRSDPAAGLA